MCVCQCNPYNIAVHTCHTWTSSQGQTWCSAQQSVDSKIVPVSSIAPEGWGPKEGGNATSPLHSRGSPNNGGQNQKSKPTLGVTMMLLVSKRGFKDCPGFLNSTGRLGPKRGRKCYITPAFSGVPNKGGQNQNSKPLLWVTMGP